MRKITSRNISVKHFQNTQCSYNNSSTTFAGVISGSGNLVKQGTGTWTLSGTNTYTGGTTITTGYLALGSSTALPSGGDVTVNGTVSGDQGFGVTMGNGNDTVEAKKVTVTGTLICLDAGVPGWVSGVLGVVTGAGGGVIRDVLARERPMVLVSEIYAVAALAGAAALPSGMGTLHSRCTFSVHHFPRAERWGFAASER